MAKFKIPGVRLAGVASCVPEQIVSNHDFPLFSEKEKEIFIRTTGIEKRRIAKPGITSADLCQKSAEVLIDHLGWKPQEVDILIFLSQLSDYITPCSATILQNEMGLSKTCLAFDINLGCSGYVYGLSVAKSLLSRMASGSKALLLVGDVSSFTVSDTDKSVAPLFSDAGSATALIADSTADESFFNLQSDGSGAEAIMIKAGGMRHPVSNASFEPREISPGIVRSDLQLGLNGIDIFNFSLKEVAPNGHELMQFANRSVDDFDYFLFHQANKLMNETVRKKMKLPVEKVPYSLKEFGNTSSATIPVTMVTQLSEELKQKDNILFLSGFGVGLSWGSAAISANEICCPELVVYG